MRLTTSAALALQLCSLPQPPLLTPRTAPARIRACEPADASWDDVPWEDGPLGGGVLLDVDDAAERLHPELGALVEQDCMALLQHAKQPDAQLSLTLCDDVAIHGACAALCAATVACALPRADSPHEPTSPRQRSTASGEARTARPTCSRSRSTTT